MTREDLQKPEGEDIDFVKGSLSEIAKKAKHASKKNIWLIGGANITQGMLKEDLIDEMIIAIMPKTLGSGISLFGSNETKSKFKLSKLEEYKSSVIVAHYDVLKQF